MDSYQQKYGGDAPILVHCRFVSAIKNGNETLLVCSAGCGRTGTVVVVDIIRTLISENVSNKTKCRNLLFIRRLNVCRKFNIASTSRILFLSLGSSALRAFNRRYVNAFLFLFYLQTLLEPISAAACARRLLLQVGARSNQLEQAADQKRAANRRRVCENSRNDRRAKRRRRVGRLIATSAAAAAAAKHIAGVNRRNGGNGKRNRLNKYKLKAAASKIISNSSFHTFSCRHFLLFNF